MSIFKTSLIDKILFLIFIVSSFDIFLNIKIGGFTLRLIYLLEFIILFYILNEYLNGKLNKIRFLKGKYLVTWIFFIFLFIPNTTILLRNFGYAIWLILSVLLIIIFSTLIKDKLQMNKILHYYILSFKYIAIFGLIQFLFGLFGVDLLIKQWWIYGVFPRINGFSYEPSYYGSYLIIGWLLLLYLRFNSSFFQNKYKITFFIITISLILSSSRMTILVMLISFYFLIFIPFVKKIIIGKINKKYITKVIFFFIFLICMVSVIILFWNDIYFLFNGLGIFGTPSHSSGTRIKEMIDTFMIFLNSPIIGYSLGGLPLAIAELRGYHISTQLEAKNFEGMNIFIEVLAASGIIGYIFFILFIFLLFNTAKNTAKKLKYISCYNYIIIKALSFSLFWEFFILSMNQNILRPYLWVLIGMLSASIFVGKQVIYEAKIRN